MLKKYLDEFYPEVRELMELGYPNYNVVLAGSSVLAAYGLNLGWTPNDLDVVIFNPTDNQKEFCGRNFQSCIDDYKSEERDDETRVWKILRNGLAMNVIMAVDIDTPDDLLLYSYQTRLIPCNSISNIIAAKVSYVSGDAKDKMRAKDIFQLMQLKNLNFNVREPILKEMPA